MSSKQVQVEARTLSGVHLGRGVEIDGYWANVAAVEHEAGGTSVTIWLDGHWTPICLAPTDLVTLTGGGASS